MFAKTIPAIVLASAILAAPAFAAGTEYQPGYVPGAPEPEAADNTLGLAVMSAVVNEDGTLARGSGVTSAATLGTGAYEVIFKRNVRACSYVATAGDPGAFADPPPGMATVTGRFTDENGVYLRIYDEDGNLAAQPFFLLVFCWQ